MIHQVGFHPSDVEKWRQHYRRSRDKHSIFVYFEPGAKNHREIIGISCKLFQQFLRFSPEVGSTSCLPCAAGNFSRRFGSSSCEFCSPGHFATSLGTSMCRVCEDAHFRFLLEEFEARNLMRSFNDVKID